MSRVLARRYYIVAMVVGAVGIVGVVANHLVGRHAGHDLLGLTFLFVVLLLGLGMLAEEQP